MLKQDDSKTGTGIYSHLVDEIINSDITKEGQDFPEMMVGLTLKEKTFKEINNLLDNCRALSLEGYLGDIDTARRNLKNILTDIQKVRAFIYDSVFIGEK